MRRHLLVAAALVAVVETHAPPPRRLRPLVIGHASVVDPATSTVARDRWIAIDEGIIVAVGDSTIPRPPNAFVVDAGGRFVIPGLWDAHVHFMNTGRSALSLYIANGVTSVREMGGFIDSTRAWERQFMPDSPIPGPRIVTPAMILETPRYLANVRVRDTAFKGKLAERILPYRLGVSDSASAQQAIDSLRALRVNFVKFRTVASVEALDGIIGAAHRAGLRVAGHEPGVVSLARACEMGQDDIEHAFYIPDDSTRRRLLACGRSRTVWYTPTLTVSNAVMLSGDSANALIFGPASAAQVGRPYASDWLLGWWRMQVDERMSQPEAIRAEMRRRYGEVMPFLREMKAAGFRFMAGTDAGSVLVYPGFSLHDELELLVKDAGFTPAEALYAATVEPATFAKMETRVGRIARGYAGDLVVLDANPLEDITNTRKIMAVVTGGRYLDRQALDGMLARIRR